MRAHARQTFNILLCNTEENDERERLALDMVLEKRIDGIIIVPTGGNAALLQDLVENGLPIVLADRHLTGMQADAVVVDNRNASFAITDHLIRIGHRRIGALRANSMRARSGIGWPAIATRWTAPVLPDLASSSAVSRRSTRP